MGYMPSESVLEAGELRAHGRLEGETLQRGQLKAMEEANVRRAPRAGSVMP